MMEDNLISKLWYHLNEARRIQKILVARIAARIFKENMKFIMELKLNQNVAG